MVRIAFIAVLAAVVAGCAAKPNITMQKTTLGQVDLTGLDCRVEKPPGSNMRQTICASPAAWKEFDDKQADQADRMLDASREKANGAFARR